MSDSRWLGLLCLKEKRMNKETIAEYRARGGKITNCPPGKAKGSDYVSKHPSSIHQQGRKKNTLRGQTV